MSMLELWQRIVGDLEELRRRKGTADADISLVKALSRRRRTLAESLVPLLDRQELKVEHVFSRRLKGAWRGWFPENPREAE
jgi:hypothetical protein